MPTHDPIQQLEPANLLEPWEMADRKARQSNEPGAGRPDEPVQSSRHVPPGESAWHGPRRRRFAMPVLMLVGLLALGFGAGAALPQLTRSLTGDRAAKVQPQPSVRSDSASHKVPAVHDSAAPARCDQKPLARQCRNDTAAASGDPSPSRAVAPDRNADGSSRVKPDATPPAAPPAPGAPPAPAAAAAAPPAATPPAQPTASPPTAATPKAAANAETTPDTEQVSVPQRSEQSGIPPRPETRRERKASHHQRHEQTRHASRPERRERPAAPSETAPTPTAQAKTESPPSQASQGRAEPRTEQPRRAERRSGDHSRHSRRYRDRDRGDDTRLSARDRDDDYDSRRSGRYRDRGDDEVSAEAEDRPGGRSSHSGSPFPFFPFFGQSGQSW